MKRESYLTARFECLCSFQAWINPSIYSVQCVLLIFPSWYKTRRENLVLWMKNLYGTYVVFLFMD